MLDEPTAGVDIELRQMLWAYIRQLNAQGTTIILTTYYLEEAQEMCNEIAIINHGQIVAQDSTRNLVESIDAKTLVVFPDNRIGDRKLNLPECVSLEHRSDGSLAMTYSRSRVRVGDILAALAAEQITIRDIASEDGNLEDVFVSLTSDGHADS